MSASGRRAAFIERVKTDSIADLEAHLQPGERIREVLLALISPRARSYDNHTITHRHDHPDNRNATHPQSKHYNANINHIPTSIPSSPLSLFSNVNGADPLTYHPNFIRPKNTISSAKISLTSRSASVPTTHVDCVLSCAYPWLCVYVVCVCVCLSVLSGVSCVSVSLCEDRVRRVGVWLFRSFARACIFLCVSVCV